MASRVDIQISILKFNFQPRFWFRFSISLWGGYPIWWDVLRFWFQNSISIFKFSSCPASPNVVLVYIILCLWLCWYVIYYALYYIWYIYSTFLIGYFAVISHFSQRILSHSTHFSNEFMQHFTHFSRQFYAEWCTKARYIFDMLSDIWCTESHLVAPASCTLSHFVAFIIHLLT